MTRKMMYPNKLDSNPNVVFCRFSKSAGNALVRALNNSSCSLSVQYTQDLNFAERRTWLCKTLEEFKDSDSDEQVKRVKADLLTLEERLWRKRDKSAWNEYVNKESEKGVNTFQLEWAVPEFFDDLLEENEVFTCMRVPYNRLQSEFCCEQKHLFTYENGQYVKSPKPGQTCSEWMKETLYWKSEDSQEIFKVSVNKSNYHVRFLCGLSADPTADVTSEHRGALEKAKRRLKKFIGIIILNDVDSYSLLRRWHYYDRLKRVNVNYKKVREDLFDISKEEFEKENALDYELFEYAKQLTLERLKSEELESQCLDHLKTPIQDEIMAQTDIIIPIRERGVLLRTLLEALDLYYSPRRLIVVTRTLDVAWLQEQIDSKRWRVNVPVIVLDEDELWKPMGLTRSHLMAVYESNTVSCHSGYTVKSREFGWWYQQVIKLGIGLLIPDISENYYVWDADLIPLKRWKLADRDKEGNIRYYTAILQHSSRGGNAAEYIKCLNKTMDLELLTPECGGTFVTHHMAFNKTILREMLEVLTKNVQERGLTFPADCRGLWPLAIIGLSQKFTRFSEYLTYAIYTSVHYKFDYHKFPKFGRNAIRIRGDSQFIPKMLKCDDVMKMNPDFGNGFSYEQFAAFSGRFYKHSVMPTVLQLDHVFSLLPEPSAKYWNYYENYIYGCPGVTLKSYEESEIAKNKVVERMAFWWKEFERIGCLFIHIPRNAGTSVEAILIPDNVHRSQHFTAMEFRDDNFKLFNKLIKFCTVRNPYDRIVSAWQYLRAGGNQNKGDKEWETHFANIGTFSDFVRYYFAGAIQGEHFDWNSYRLPAHFVPQSKFITNETGELLVDVCVEFKDFLKLGLGKLIKNGVTGDILTQPAPHRRSSEKKHGTCVYDEDTAEMIYKTYEDDFRLLNYDKDSWKKIHEQKTLV